MGLLVKLAVISRALKTKRPYQDRAIGTDFLNQCGWAVTCRVRPA